MEETMYGFGYGNVNVFQRRCDYSGDPICDPPLPGTPQPLTTLPGGTGYSATLLDIEIAFKKLGKVLVQKAALAAELVDGPNIQCQWWYSADASVENGGVATASCLPIPLDSNASIGIGGISTITMAVIPTQIVMLDSPPVNVINGPPQSFDISSVNGWCQWSQGIYKQRQWMIPESFDGDEENKPFRTLDQTGPYVYVCAMPTTDDNQLMTLCSYTDGNDIVSSTKVVMHKLGSKFVSDYIVITDEPNYAGTIVGESGQTYRCVFVEDGGHLTIQSDAVNGIVNLTDFSREAAEYETVDSMLPFFQRYLKDKFAP